MAVIWGQGPDPLPPCPPAPISSRPRWSFRCPTRHSREPCPRFHPLGLWTPPRLCLTWIWWLVRSPWAGSLGKRQWHLSLGVGSQ